MEGGSSGDVIVPGNADGSRLFKLVTGAETPIMPPDGQGERLTAEQIELLRTWLSLGAPENSGSKIMLAEAETQEVGQMYVAADIVDGPPPMPEVAMPLLIDNPPLVPARAIATNPRSPLLAVAGFFRRLSACVTAAFLIRKESTATNMTAHATTLWLLTKKIKLWSARIVCFWALKPAAARVFIPRVVLTCRILRIIALVKYLK